MKLKRWNGTKNRPNIMIIGMRHIVWVVVIGMDWVLKRMQSKHSNGLKSRPNEVTLQHKIGWEFFTKVVPGLKRIYKKHFIGIRERQIVTIKLHNII